jgi:hypothetical protein
MDTSSYLYCIRVEGILQLKQTLRWGYKVTNNQMTWQILI